MLVRAPQLDRIRISENKLEVPREISIPYIVGDGIGEDISPITIDVLRTAVEAAYTDRRIEWFELPAGDAGERKVGSRLPSETLQYLREHVVSLKGPLATPVAAGFRSVNVILRKLLDLYACVRPCRYTPGVPSPMKHPEHVNVVVFRENTEDVYMGVEYEKGSDRADKLRRFLGEELGDFIREGSGIGIKPISEFGSKRFVRKAIQYAFDRKRDLVTLVHKGNIMKHTEGAFMRWGYEVAEQEFAGRIVKGEGPPIPGKVRINDRIADNMFQQVILRPDKYAVLATPNLTGDYLSDTCAALVGGLGLAPGANIGDHYAVFEATHGTAPDIAGKDLANPSGLVLSGRMLLNYIGWDQAAQLVTKAVELSVQGRRVTADLAVQMEKSSTVGSREFGEILKENIRRAAR
ncbi:MAG TPA: NADP-dependent isocitrate dehydrogenase [Acidobacteriota bacterium]